MRRTISTIDECIFLRTAHGKTDISNVVHGTSMFSFDCKVHGELTQSIMIFKCDMTFKEIQKFINWCTKNHIPIRSE